MFRNATDEIMLAHRVAMSELTNHLIDRLTGTGDGKVKTFKKSMIEKFNEFLDGFAARNIAEDGELDKLVKKAKQLLEGVEPEKLREDASIQEKLKSGFEDVKKSLDSMLENKGRKFRIDTEADAVAAFDIGQAANDALKNQITSIEVA